MKTRENVIKCGFHILWKFHDFMWHFLFTWNCDFHMWKGKFHIWQSIRINDYFCGQLVGIVLNVNILYDVFILYFSFFPRRILSMRRYRNAFRSQTQEMQWKQFMQLPTFPQIPLPHCITLPSTFKTALTKLEVRQSSSNPVLPVTTLPWSTTKAQPTLLSMRHLALQSILSTQQSASHSNNEGKVGPVRIWGHLINVWPRIQINTAQTPGIRPKYLDVEPCQSQCL